MLSGAIPGLFLLLFFFRINYKFFNGKEEYKMGIDKVGIVKVAGWLTAAVAGIMVSWASDKQAQKQNEENFQKYIENKENGESWWALLFCLLQENLKGE